MRSFVIATLSTVAFARHGMGRMGGMWWGGAPECAQSCLSSVWGDEASMTEWPSPGAFCTASVVDPLTSCLESDCTSTMTAWSSFSSLSSSLCSVYASCTADENAVFTLTKPTGTMTGRWGGSYGPWSTYTGDGTVTVTGCPTGYGGYGMGHGGFMPWGAGNPDDAFWGWGAGWSSLTTITETVTTTVSGSESVIVSTYAQAVSDGTTMTSTLGAADAVATGSSGSSSDDTGSGHANGVNEVALIGAALGAAVAVIGLL